MCSMLFLSPFSVWLVFSSNLWLFYDNDHQCQKYSHVKMGVEDEAALVVHIIAGEKLQQNHMKLSLTA